jgi:peptide/nickel transport system substrate-binding protein
MTRTGDQVKHRKVGEALDLVARGRMSRREFVRIAALLGVAAGSAYALAGLPAPAFAADNLPFPADDPAAKAGGTLRIAMLIQKMEDPATYTWGEMANQTRHILEYLTSTGTDNITRPMLAESWEASEDLRTWTFRIRPGVTWHNGEALTAEHVAWNLTRWLDPALGSGNRGLSTFAAMLRDTDRKDDKGKVIKEVIPGALEVLDAMTIRLNLSKPVLSVPQDLNSYPCAILHPSFKAPFSDNPIGTGPFTLAELKVGERCILKRVTQTADGKPFAYWGGKVYLDEIHYYNFDNDNQLTAFASGDVEAIYQLGVEQLELAKSLDQQILTAQTSQNLFLRMQVDQKPFDDPRVRKAMQLAVDRTAINNLVYPGNRDVGEDHAVAPVHPEYFALPPLRRDVAAARALLAEAGHGDGLELTIDVGNTNGPWQQTVCEAVRDQLQDAGIKLNVNVMPASKYWEIWNTTAFGASAWTHRPLGTMVNSLAFRSGVAWNETHFADPAFDAALDEAEGTLDVEARRAKMATVEKILQDAAVAIMPIWRPIYFIVARQVHGYPAHPTQDHLFNKVWIG